MGTLRSRSAKDGCPQRPRHLRSGHAGQGGGQLEGRVDTVLDDPPAETGHGNQHRISADGVGHVVGQYVGGRQNPPILEDMDENSGGPGVKEGGANNHPGSQPLRRRPHEETTAPAQTSLPDTGAHQTHRCPNLSDPKDRFSPGPPLPLTRFGSPVKGWIGQVPSCQPERYSRCSSVSSSRPPPRRASLIEETTRSISAGSV